MQEEGTAAVHPWRRSRRYFPPAKIALDTPAVRELALAMQAYAEAQAQLMASSRRR